MAALRCIVLGAGINGLMSALMLRQAGHSVRIVSAAQSPHTVSDIAAAIWHPYICSPIERVIPWATSTYKYFFQQLSQGVPGIIETELYEVFTQPRPAAFWSKIVTNYRQSPITVGTISYQDSYGGYVPVINSSQYMSHLHQLLAKLGVTITTIRPIHSLTEYIDQADVLVNCLGLGASSVCNDRELFPVKGIVARVKRPSSLPQIAYVHEEGPELTYLIPRVTDCIIGGTAYPHDATTNYTNHHIREMLSRVGNWVPALQDAVPLEVLVGPRPARSLIRLELEQQGATKMIHNYGHGGAGWTLSAGCAEEVVRIVENRQPTPS